jgi:hypothetical protein
MNPPSAVDEASFLSHTAAATSSGGEGVKKEPAQDPRYLLNAVKNLMRTRHGSVLSRNTILKMDHFEKGMNTKLDFHLQGAPNFRVADLNVYGVAQPTVRAFPCSCLKEALPKPYLFNCRLLVYPLCWDY